MATSFDRILNRAISKIADYDILKLDEQDRQKILDEYLLSAQTEFQHICKIDLSQRDEDRREYINDLDEEIVEILATGVVYYWLTPKVLNTEHLQNVLTTKDFALYSPANLLKELKSLREMFYNEFKRKMFDYSFRAASIKDWKV